MIITNFNFANFLTIIIKVPKEYEDKYSNVKNPYRAKILGMVTIYKIIIS
jgi:hypothetical protein